MNRYRKSLLILGDIACFVGGFYLSMLVAFGAKGFQDAASRHALPLSVLALIWIGIFFIFNFYDLRVSKPNLIFFRNFGIAAIIMLGAGFAFFYLNPTTRVNPKLNLVIFEGISLFLVLAWRRFFYLATINSFHTHFALVCPDERHESLLQEIRSNRQLGFHCIGVYKTLQEFKQAHTTTDLLIIHKTAAEESEIIEELLKSHVDIIDLAEAYEKILYKIPVHFIDTHWIIRSIKKEQELFSRFISRTISILFALTVLVLTSPISILIIIAIKLEDRGPVFYGHIRSGIHGKPFMLYKFRSMITNAERNGATWTAINDPRITRVGAITRRLHIDEIPQMFNLLRGDLTLVGPRPERPEFVAELEKQIPYYFMRHTIRPGFTGWAQIKFRYARTVMDSLEKFEYDLYYIKNRNIFLDIGIIMKTIQIIFTH